MLKKQRTTFVLLLLVFLSGLGVRSLWDSAMTRLRIYNNINDLTKSEILPGTPPVTSPEASSNRCQNIYHLVCQRNPVAHDPTGVVRSDIEGEKLALSLYAEIIHKHRDWTIEQIDEEMALQTFTPRRRGRIETAFQWVKTTIEEFVDQQTEPVFSTREKAIIKARLQKTKLEIPPPASIYADEPDLLTKNEIYYERTPEGKMKLRVGGAYLFVAKSWFNIVFTLAHELAHSIDPCEIRAAHLSFPAYNYLAACFSKSGLIAARKDHSECGSNDQLSETFADWMGVQVTAKALKFYSTEFHGPQIIDAARNSVRDLCEQEIRDSDISTEFHPSPSIRISKIFGNNPAIRSLLGCQEEPIGPPYCTLNSFTPPLHSEPTGVRAQIYEK
jgi:hypothetical protein